MSPSDSYDPRTWHKGGHGSFTAPEVPPAVVPSRGRGWLPLGLSAAVLIAGAALAHADRGAPGRPPASEAG